MSITFLLSISNVICSQVPVYQSFTTEDGLPSNEVYHVYQDINGLMWFATDRGIASYDGYEFKTYTTEEGLTSNTIFKFYPQEDENIWCTTINNKLFYFDPNELVFREYRFNHLVQKDGHDCTPADMKISKSGTLYISFFNRYGYLSIDKTGKITNSTRNIYEKSPLLRYRSINTIEIDQYPFIYPDFTDSKRISENTFTDSLYRATRFDRLDIKDASIYLGTESFYITKGKEISFKKKQYNLILLGQWDENHFWISTQNKGLEVYNLAGKRAHHFLNDYTISHVIKDHQGATWISTLEKGVFHMPNIHLHNFKFHDNQSVTSISHNNHELSILLYNNSLHRYTNGIFQKGNPSEKIEQIEFFDEFGKVKSQFIFEDIERSIISIDDIETVKACITKNISDNKKHPPILSNYHSFRILQDDQWNHYSINMELNDACYLGYNVLLAQKNGLIEYDLRKETYTSFSPLLEGIHIPDIDNLDTKNFVAATRGHGLVIYKDDKLEFVKHEDGLASNHCNEVYLQNDSTVWVCTSKGLNKVLLRNDGKKTIQSYSTICGLMDNDILDFDILKDTAWIASKSGLTSVPIKHFKSDSIQRETIFDLIKLSVNGIDTSSLVQLSHDENRLQFNFRTISFTSAPVTYRYRLKGLENQWNITSEREALYQSVPSGEYTFEVQTAINNIWQEKVIQIPVSINPPFYRTWWFRFFIVFLIGGIIYLFFRYRLLSYNWDLSREILRKVLKRLNKENTSFIVESNGKQVKIESSSVLYVEAQRNYIEIHTIEGRHLVREKISSFTELVPDPIEYIRISRSCVVRIDQVTAKSKQSISIRDTELKVGKTYISVLNQIHL